MTEARVPDREVYIELRRRGQAAPITRRHPHRLSRPELARPGVARRRWLALDRFPLDGAYAFALFVAMLFVQEVGSLAGLAMTALPLGYIALRWPAMKRMAPRRWIVFLPPAFALASVLWSEAPGISTRYGLEMWLTAAGGLCLAAAARPEQMLKGMCLAFAAYIGLSLVGGHWVGVGVGAGGEAFAGLGDGKNLMGDIASTGALVSFTVLFMALKERSALWALIALISVAIEVYTLFASRSAGAALAFGAASCGLFCLVALHATPKLVRMTALGLVLASVAIITAVQDDLAGWLVGVGSRIFDKDPTLTGRTYLWYRAHDLIEQKPWFGHGFNAFWRLGNTDAEGLWRYAGITGRSGFNFHNTLVELTVELGLIGAALFCLVGLIGLLALVRRFVLRPSLPVCFWLAFFAYELVHAPIEAIGYLPFYYSTALLFAAVGAGLEPVPVQAQAPRGAALTWRLHRAYAERRDREPAPAAKASR